MKMENKMNELNEEQMKQVAGGDVDISFFDRGKTLEEQ